MKARKLIALVLTGAMAASTLLVGTGVSAAESGSERTKITALLRASETSAKYIILKKLLTEFSEEHGLEEPEFELVSGDADYVTSAVYQQQFPSGYLRLCKRCAFQCSTGH